MTENLRGGYGFSKEDKAWVRKMSEGKSALSDEPHNNTVHHITGCYLAKLDGIPKETVSDVFQNAIMLDDEMAKQHDEEEAYQVACLEYELKGRTLHRGVRNTRHHRRRRR